MQSCICLVAVLSVLTLCKGQGQDPKVPGSKGSVVVETTLDILKTSCLFSDDQNFLRRMAYAATQDGNDPYTYVQQFDGGIWHITQAQFDRTHIESARLKYEYDILKQQLGIDWFSVSWNDLLKPLYSGIAAALLVTLEGGANSVPTDVNGQATYWQQKFALGKTTQDFVTKTNELQKLCTRTGNLDVLFLVDTSSNSAMAQWMQLSAHLKNVLADLYNQNGLGPTGDRMSLITFSNRAILAFPFSKTADLTSTSTLIDLAPRVGGSTNLTDAIIMAKQQVLPNARPDAEKVMVIILDGQPDQTSRAVNELLPLMLDVEVYAIGVGQAILPNDLDQLSSLPHCTHTKMVSSLADLANLKMNLGMMVCEAPQTLLPGKYTYPCGQEINAQLPGGGKGYSVTISLTDGQAQISASYNTLHPTPSKDLLYVMDKTRPVLIQSTDPRPLAFNVNTGSGSAKSCVGNIEVVVEDLTPRQKECNGRYMDMLFLWDAAVIPDAASFNRLVNLTEDVASKFDVGNDKHRVGVAWFDRSAHSLISLKNSSSVPNLVSTLQQLNPITSGPPPTDLAQGLQWVRQIGLSFQHGARHTASKTLVVVTKGVPANQAMVRQEAQLLQNEGVRVVVIAVDTQFDDNTLTELASTQHRLEKVSDLSQAMLKVDEIGDIACRAVDVQCVENGVQRPCSAADLINSHHGPNVVGDRNLTTNPCLPVPGAPIITKFPHPSKLDRFILCDSKHQPYIVLCPLGQIYNKTLEECEASPLAYVPTTILPIGILTTNPGGINPVTTTPQVVTTMKPFTTPPPTTATTMMTTTPTTTPSPTPCTYENIVKGNKFQPYPGDNTKYIECSNVPGQVTVQQCPQGQVWDQASKSCFFACIIVDPNAGTIDCSLPNPCGGALVYYAHPRDVTKYIQCSPTQEAFLKSCPQGQIWKPLLANCDNP